ncbi:MAG: glycosyltransferase family 2 protein [Candidatus Krumholzibacteria bacterium]|nr:glycosyltransferase family 2 protein [Candidatus Krumholzibacteria bacterium]
MDIAAKLLFLIILGVTIYTYAGYPLVLFVLGLFKRNSGTSSSLDEYPSVALIISAHDEKKIIREKIENSLKLDYPKDRLRIIIASDGSVDGTNDIVREYECGNVVLKAFDSREGKSAALNKAVFGLEEDILIFSDANAFYKEDTVKKLVHKFSCEDVGCVVGHLVYLENHSYVGKGESLYWRYESLLNRLESRLGSVLVATGTIFAMRRELFRPVMQDVANDFQLPAEISSQGFRVVYESEAIAYERSTYYFREEFSRKRRIIVRGLTGFKYMRSSFGSTLRIFQFVSRKLLRWWVGPMLPILYFANLLLIKEPLFLVLFALQNIFYLFAAIGSFLRRGRKVQSRLFFIPFYFVMVNTAAFTAIVTYVGGSRLSSWDKAETTRDVNEHPMITPRLRVIEGRGKLSYQEKENGLKNLEKIP